MSEFIDQTLVDTSGGDVGTITDVIANPVDLRLERLVVRVSPLGGEHLVPMEAIEASDGQLVAAVTREQVKAAPRVHRTGRPFFNDPSHERALLDKTRAGIAAIGLWDTLATDWLVIDAELLPWSAKAEEPVRTNPGSRLMMAMPCGRASAAKVLAIRSSAALLAP